MSDVRGQSSAFLYFWRRYRDETRGGPIFRVVVLAETLEEARALDEDVAKAASGD